jgi:GT2 family glycosyltransferase
MDLIAFLEDILIVIVVYKKDVRQVLTDVILPQHSNLTVFLYDNSPVPQKILGERILYQHDHTNPGVSKAYNKAMQTAMSLKKKWMLLLDHDTVLDKDTFSVFHRALIANPDKTVFTLQVMDSKGIVSPYRFFLGRGMRVGKITPGVHAFKKLLIINGGMLIATETFHRAGGYDERFPLDFSDVVFIERLRIISPEFILINVSCQHQLSINNAQVALPDAISRFSTYCKAVRLYRDISKKFIVPMFAILPVSLKLLVRYKNAEFLKIALTS